MTVTFVLAACRLVGGDGSAGDGGDDGPVVDPAAQLGSVALTADCAPEGDDGTIQTFSLKGTYDCVEGFDVTMKNEASSQAGAVRMRLAVVQVAPLEPVPGPTPTTSQAFAVGGASTDGGSCQTEGGIAVCQLESLPVGKDVLVNLEITPPPGGAEVTTEVELFEA